MLYIHPITIIYIILGISANHFNSLLYLYSIALIHELSHIFCAKIFKLKLKEIVLYPTGFKAEIKDFANAKAHVQILIILAGPLSFFITFLMANILFKMNLISQFGLRTINEYNLVILLFNLLPIYPLDGGKLIDIALANFFDEKVTRIIRIVVSFIFLIVFMFALHTLGDILMFIMVLISLISSTIKWKKDYFTFLILRKYEINKYKDKVNDRPCIYRYKKNWYLKDSIIYNESQIIDVLLKSKKR